MDESKWLAERFEANRLHLRAVAFRMLGSLSEAEDAVQEAWLRFDRTDTAGVENLGGWLTTVVARICLDMLRTRKGAGREQPLETEAATGAASDAVEVWAQRAGERDRHADPEYETILADSVGLALLVVLETLAPAERLAFVLHDLFDLPFDEIAPIVERSPTAARQLASRARRRVRGAATGVNPDRTRQRVVVDAFLTAARGGDFEALLTLLDPDVVLRTDAAALPAGAPREVRGAELVARRSARGGARAAQPALVNGAVGVVVAPRGQLLMVLHFTLKEGRIAMIDAIADPERLAGLELALLDD